MARAYGAAGLRFGPEYLIPQPFDPRLIEAVAPAVAQAAMDSGVATRPIADIAAYRQRLSRVRLPVRQRDAAGVRGGQGRRQAPKRVVYAEGEDERVLRAAQVAVDERLARPMLVGRPAVIAERIAQYGLRLKLDGDCECVDLLDPAVYGEASEPTTSWCGAAASRAQTARTEMRSRGTLLGGHAGPPGQGRRDAVRHRRPLSPTTCAMCATRSACAKAAAPSPPCRC